MRAVQFHFVRQRVRNGHLRAMLPELRILTLIKFVVQDDEVADAFVLKAALPVVLLNVHRVEALIREVVDESGNLRLHQMNGSRLQGFHETAGQTDRHHIAVPALLAQSRYELEAPWLGQRLAVQIGQQGRGRFVVADKLTAVDVAIANAVLQGNTPLPAGPVRRGAGVGQQLWRRFTGNGQRRVTLQPLGPVLVAGLQGLLDQETAKTRTVDEKVAFDPLAAGQQHCVHMIIRWTL